MPPTHPRRRFAVLAVVCLALALVGVGTGDAGRRAGAVVAPTGGGGVAVLTPIVTLEFSPTTGPFTTPVWVDISAYWMRDAEVSGGRQSELPEFSPSRMSVALNNSDRRFDPAYSAGPYYGNLKPRRPIRLSVFYGTSVLVDSAGGAWALSVTTAGALVTTAAPGKPASGAIVISDSGGTEWAVTVSTAGALTTTVSGAAQANVPVLRDANDQNWQVGVDTAGTLTTATTASAATGVVKRLFTGFVDGWPQEYEPPRLGLSRVTATDVQSILATLKTESAWEQEVRADSPALWWRLGEELGTVAQDSSGNAHDGTYNGGATFGHRAGHILGDDDGAILLSGYLATTGLSTYVSTEDTLITGTGDFTVEFWWSHSYDQSAELQPRPIAFGGNDTAGYWKIWSRDTDNGLGFLTGDKSGTTIASYTTALNDSDPYHVVCRRTAGTLTIAINGSVVATTAGSTHSIAAGLTRLGVGDSLGLLGGVEDAVYDEFAVYGSSLSTTRITAHYNAGHAPWDEDSPTERITAILDDAGFPAADRNLDTGSAQLGVFEEGNTLKSLQDVGQAETGRSMQYVDGAGKWTFVGRHDFWTGTAYTTSQATLGDSSTELGYTVGGGFRLDYDDYDIINSARIAPRTGWFQEFTSTGSVDSYGPAGVERRIIEKRAALALNTAEYLATERADSVARLDELTLSPEADPARFYPVILAAEYGHRFTVKRRPQGVGSAISIEGHLDHVVHKLTPGTWETRWRLGRAEADYWQLDVSELDISTRLGV